MQCMTGKKDSLEFTQSAQEVPLDASWLCGTELAGGKGEANSKPVQVIVCCDRCNEGGRQGAVAKNDRRGPSLEDCSEE